MAGCRNGKGAEKARGAEKAGAGEARKPEWLGVPKWRGCQNRNVGSPEFDAVVRAVNQRVVLAQPA